MLDRHVQIISRKGNSNTSYDQEKQFNLTHNKRNANYCFLQNSKDQKHAVLKTVGRGNRHSYTLLVGV